MTTITATRTATELATEILARKALAALEEARTKALEQELIAMSKVGDKIVAPNGSITVTQRHDMVVDVAALKQVVSRNVFAAVTTTKVSADAWRSMASLGKLNDNALALVTTKPSAVFHNTTVAKQR